LSEPRAGFDPKAFRKSHNRLLGIGSEIVAPLLRLGSYLAARRAPSAPAQWRSGLIVGHSHIGDVLYRTCSLPALTKAFPECRWSYLTSPEGALVLDGNPEVADVLPWNVGDDSWQLTPDAFAELRRRDFDAILCTNTLRYHPDLFLAAALGIPNRVAFTHKGLGGLATRSITPEYPSPYPAYFRTMVATLAGVAPVWPLRPRILVSKDDRRQAASALEDTHVDANSPIVACSITTKQARGSWPTASVLALLREARRQSSFQIALCGAPDDEEALAAANAALDGTAAVLAGKLDLRQFAALLERSAALVTLDSGARHVGNAIGLPVFFFRNMLASQVETGTYCDTETDLAPAGQFLTDAEIYKVAREYPVDRAARTLAERITVSAQRE